MTNPPDREMAVFSAARRLPGTQHAAYLDEACAGDAALRQRVEELLQAGEEAGAFLQEPAAGAQRPSEAAGPSNAGATLLITPAPAEKAGDRIGRYKLLQQIGEGGCGVVYMAEQEQPVRRMVALKVIKLGMDTKSVIARFEAERQALALMEHPNIAKILDVGATDTGRPYFVMELVRGIKITDYCDKSNLPTRERLDLFVQVCQAVQHAHQKGVIHRDLKPSNILVTLRDGVPVPKVIDFGIAKATQQRLTDKTLFTAFEQFIGTPAYMSPEQAEMSELGIDTRSDIYSLGVLLYELLTGTTPFDSKALLQAGLDEIRRIIREQEPVRPSTRLSTMIVADLAEVARHRQSETGKLSGLIRGDLDWIVMKALEKDRARRYETANGLARDVQRYLADEPVVARPPSNLYRFQKMVRRNKGAFAATAAIATVLVIGVVVSTWQAIRATRAEREQVQLRQRAQADQEKARTEAAKSEQVAQFLKDMLTSAGPNVALGQDTTLLRGILDRTAERVNNYLTNQPEVQGELLDVSGWVYFSMGETAKAEAAFRQALAVQRRVLGNNHPDLADSLFGLAGVLAYERPEESETLYRESLEIRRKVYGNQHRTVAACLNEMTAPLVAQGKLAEAESFGREALAMKRKLLANDDPDVALSLKDLGLVVRAEGKLAEAERLLREGLAIFRRTVSGADPDVAFTLGGLADVLSKEGNLAEAETAYREALAIQRKLYNTEAPQLLSTLLGLTTVLRSEGKLGECETLSREYLELQEKVWDKQPLEEASLPNLASRVEFFGRQGRWKEALAAATKMIALGPREHFGYQALAPLQVQVGDLDAYRITCQQAVAHFRGTEDIGTAEQMAKNCLILPESGADLSVVSAWATTAVSLGKDSEYLPWFQLAKGLAEYRTGHFADALEWTQRALAEPSREPNRDVEATAVLAMAYLKLSQTAAARTTLAKALELEAKRPIVDSGNLDDHWLDWIIAHALIREAKTLIQFPPATPKE